MSERRPNDRQSIDPPARRRRKKALPRAERSPDPSHANTWQTVVGVEMHARLATRSKLFCACANRFGAPPNTLTCPVCAGLPGAMPVLNATAWEYAARLALATGGEITPVGGFDRKCYFYPDLPKGYQITQLHRPVSRGGELVFRHDAEERRVALQRIHLEEDAGKSQHPAGGDRSFVDLNRAGTPLLEVVTTPQLHSGDEAANCVRGLRSLLRALRIGDGDMEKGSLRCDVNVSVRRPGAALGERVELKNLNSFRAIRAAVEAEAARQIAVLRDGGRIEPQTHLWDAAMQRSQVMRLKENEAEYAYLAENDLGHSRMDAEWLQVVARSLPELPDARWRRLHEALGLPPQQAQQLTEDVELAEIFDAALQDGADARRLANWVCNELLQTLGEQNAELAQSKLAPAALAEIVALHAAGRVSMPAARRLLSQIVREGGSPGELADSQGWLVSQEDDALRQIVAAVLRQHPQAVARHRQGRAGVVEFLLGKVLQRSGGGAQPLRVREMLLQALGATGNDGECRAKD